MSTARLPRPVLRSGEIVNDLHSGLNPTRVAAVRRPRDAEEVERIVRRAAREGRSLGVSGARHAMGGQPFATDRELLDLRGLTGLRSLDLEGGLAVVGAGTNWRQLFGELSMLQCGDERPWTFRQKQTGADRLTLGGAVAVNAHGRGLDLPPFVSELESLRVVTPDGETVTASRDENADLFRLVVGGYGLFGVVTDLTLRLVPRRRLERVVRLVEARELPALFEQRLREGFLYGDFQFAVDPESADFLRIGVFSCYRPVPDSELPSFSAASSPVASSPVASSRVASFPATASATQAKKHAALSPQDWLELMDLAHRDKSRAFERYSAHYLATDGQRYESDEAQLTTYVDNYHERLGLRGGEVLSEVSVPREDLPAFLESAAACLREHEADPIYGTVRLIEPDDETALPWARGRHACVVINLHVHDEPGSLDRARRSVRGLYDEALALGGSFYLTYQDWATREQLLAGHPGLPAILAESRRRDPGAVFESNWRLEVERLLGPGEAHR